MSRGLKCAACGWEGDYKEDFVEVASDSMRFMKAFGTHALRVCAPCVARSYGVPVAVSAEDIKTLREETGHGLFECKSALREACNDMERARNILKTRGLA
jgi:hypothetical protein